MAEQRHGTAENGRQMAKAAGLRYVTDEKAGICRRRRGRGWSYTRPGGELIRDAAERERIAALAIPPAWTEVWICPHPRGHLQATGRDDRGRKQYRYHPAWEEATSQRKFDRLLTFGHVLPRIRQGVEEALSAEGLGRERVLAAVVALLEKTAIRIGNDEYARDNDTYGLTTIRRRHVDVRGSRIRFTFEAKGSQKAEVTVEDARLARIVSECAALRGYEVFKWVAENGELCDVKADEVNAYLRELAGEDVSAKDYRTWLGTLHAFRRLCFDERAVDGGDPADLAGEAEAELLAAIDAVADLLRNTRDVARASYIHPCLAELHRAGELRERWPAKATRAARDGDDAPEGEAALLALLAEVAGGAT